MRELPPHCFPSQRSRWHQAVTRSIDRVGRSPDLRGNMTAGGPSARFTPRHGTPTPDTPSSAGARLINSSGCACSTRGLTVDAYGATVTRASRARPSTFLLYAGITFQGRVAKPDLILPAEYVLPRLGAPQMMSVRFGAARSHEDSEGPVHR
jgi:hypothetical protein